MTKSVLIHGSSNSRHLYNFIKIVLSDVNEFSDITIFNTAFVENMPDYIYKYYYSRNIKIINARCKRIYKIRLIRILLHFFNNILVLKKEIKQHEKYNFCFVHYCSWQSVLWTNITCRYFNKIIPVAYGGDILRNKRLNNFFYRRFFNMSYKIVLPNINSQLVFSKITKKKYDLKTIVIQFPQTLVSSMLHTKELINKKNIKKKFSLPEKKYVIICGHTATRAEQYEKMISELKKCSKHILDQCCFVFMMTYAPDDYKPYQEEIESLLRDNVINSLVLKDYIQYEDIIGLHYISNVHITTIKTDALSCFLQEELLAGSALIYGKWLKYYELENGRFNVFPINDFSEISRSLTNIIENYTGIKLMMKKNKEGIIALASEDAIKKDWHNLLLQ